MPFPVEEKYIKEAESALGVTFSDSYRAAMMTNNGGSIEVGEDDWFLFSIRDASDNKRMARTMNHIVVAAKKTAEWPDFPADAIAFAEDQSGNYLVFVKNENELGPEIYLWNHEEPDELVQIADDFDELVS
jgi:hypothetical protein